jgi:DNA-damage-inducible protein J
MKDVKRRGVSGKASAKKAEAKKPAVKTRKAAAETIPKTTATGMIHARIAQSLKVKVEKILAELGLNSSDAIRLFYSQVALRKGLPFEVRIPNATTAKALRDIDAGRDVTRYGSAEELFEDLGI